MDAVQWLTMGGRKGWIIVERICYIWRKQHIFTLSFLEITVNIFSLSCKAFMVLHLCVNMESY